MQSCLGIYIQDKIIKYAKISKEHNNLKVEAYGVKFYDTDLEQIIDQIVKETFSYQVPISVNLENEKYAYSDVFALLQPKDLEKAIDTEFEVFCSTNNKNKNTLEYRRIKVRNLDDRDKVRVIYTFIDKTTIVERLQLLDKYSVKNISAMPTTITNLNKTILQENCVVIDLGQQTTLTTIMNGQIYKVDILEEGMSKIFNTIMNKEDSMSKAYEICKNTTVYTRTAQNLQIEGNEYLDEITDILLETIDKIKQTIISNALDIDSIYITGTGVVINNIDLLFQEAFMDKKCEILMPYFVEKTNVKINIKDYIEVNSAIALAMQGVSTKKLENNFNVKGNFGESFKKMFSKAGKMKRAKGKKLFSLQDLKNAELDITEKSLLRVVSLLSLIIILYIAFADTMVQSINNKMDETTEIISDTNEKIATITNYNSLINNRTSEYQSLIDRINEQNERISQNYSSKNAIPNMLNKIMYVIPTGVQLLSIDNNSGKNVTIVAQADKYDQLGYFKAALEEEGILTNITTTKGLKSGNMINITITGELPY